MRYLTFELSISALGNPHAYQLLARSSSQGEGKAATTIDFNAPPFADLLVRLKGKSLSPTELQSLGALLYTCVFVDNVKLLFDRSLGETLVKDDLGLRLRLRLESPELATLPWELLYSPERRLFLAASIATPLSRYLNLSEPQRQLTFPNQIRVLGVIPQNSGLDVESEKRILQQIEPELKPQIAVDVLAGLVTIETIRAALRRHDYHILHYAGHGAFDGEQGSLHLDHEEKFTQRISAEQFAQFFLDYPSMRLVVLNACHGASGSAHRALVGLAPQLVSRGVPAVVAMRDSIDDADAILFAKEFYAELCHERYGGQVEAAVSRARQALLQSRPESAVFASPVLYLRSQDGRLWDPVKPAKVTTSSPVVNPAVKQKSFLERWQLWAGLIATVLAIIVAVFQLYDMTSTPSVGIYRLRVTVLDQQGVPVEDAKVWSSIGGEPKKVAGGWQFDIPAVNKPENGKLVVYASKASAFLTGETDLQLGDDPNPAITIQLSRSTSAFVHGIVIDETGQAMPGARVCVVGHEDEFIVTQAGGNFKLSAHAADGQQVYLHVEKQGYEAANQWHPAGDEPATIILERR